MIGLHPLYLFHTFKKLCKFFFFWGTSLEWKCVRVRIHVLKEGWGLSGGRGIPLGCYRVHKKLCTLMCHNLWILISTNILWFPYFIWCELWTNIYSTRKVILREVNVWELYQRFKKTPFVSCLAIFARIYHPKTPLSCFSNFFLSCHLSRM